MNTALKRIFDCLLISVLCLGYDGWAARQSIDTQAFSPTAMQILVFPFKEQKTYMINANGSEADSNGFTLDQQQVLQKEQLRAAKFREKMQKSAQKVANSDPNQISTAGQDSPQVAEAPRTIKMPVIKLTGGQVKDKAQVKYKVSLISENDSVGFILADKMFSTPPQKKFGNAAALVFNMSGDYAETMKYLCVKWTGGKSVYFYCLDIKAVAGKEGLILELQTWADIRSMDAQMQNIAIAEGQQKAQLITPGLDHSQLTSFQREEAKDWNLDRARRKAQKENELYRRIVETGQLPQEKGLPHSKKADQ